MKFTTNLTLQRFQGATLFWCAECGKFGHAPRSMCSCVCCQKHALTMIRGESKHTIAASRVVFGALSHAERLPIQKTQQSAS